MNPSGIFCFEVECKIEDFSLSKPYHKNNCLSSPHKTINATSHLNPRNFPVCGLYMHVYNLTSLSLQIYWSISGGWFAAAISWPIMKLWWYIAKSPFLTVEICDWLIYRRQFWGIFFFQVQFRFCILKNPSFLHTLSPLIFSSLLLELIVSCVFRDLSLLVPYLVNVSILAFSNGFEDFPIKITFEICDL